MISKHQVLPLVAILIACTDIHGRRRMRERGVLQGSRGGDGLPRFRRV